MKSVRKKDYNSNVFFGNEDRCFILIDFWDLILFRKDIFFFYHLKC